MDDQEKDAFNESEHVKAQEDGSDERLQILNQIEAGEIDVENAVQRLRGDEVPIERQDILEELEKGEIDVQEAIKRLEGGEEGPEGGEKSSLSSFSRAEPPPYSGSWRNWWLVVLASGMGVLALGGWLGMIGGWWWLCATPALVLGLVLLIIGLSSQSAPWLHIRVDTGQETWPRHIALSFPIPIKIASWALKRWGHKIHTLDETAIDELILTLEDHFSEETPLYIEVQEDEKNGEKVQIFLG
jgi:hypothetical protein